MAYGYDPNKFGRLRKEDGRKVEASFSNVARPCLEIKTLRAQFLFVGHIHVRCLPTLSSK